jgi:nucleotide-binding universal stress UspA family protein
MGSHGKGFIKGVLLGSVSQRVVEYSDKSVFIIK